MAEPTYRVRAPVRREGASRNLLVMLLAFAASVTLTRFFLQLTGYPQLSTGTLHIAHVLWGGLLLFIASLLPLVFANRWIFPLAGFFSGIGAGLFIDEVGKFITANNNYFYPPAAPIVYVFFLLTIWLFLRVRRPPSTDARAILYGVLDGLEEVLDRDLDPRERSELIARLQDALSRTDNPAIRQMAMDLLRFLDQDTLELAPIPSGWIRSLEDRLERFEEKRIGPGRFRVFLAGGFAALGATQAAGLIGLVLAGPSPSKLAQVLEGWMSAGRVSSIAALDWFAARLALEAGVGAALIFAAGLIIMRREKAGTNLGMAGLLLSIVAVNPLVFYFDQFSTILPATIQFTWLLLTVRYRNRFLDLPIDAGKTAGALRGLSVSRRHPARPSPPQVP